MSDYLKEGQQIQVKVLDVDQRGRIKLSIKEAKADAADNAADAVDADTADAEDLTAE